MTWSSRVGSLLFLVLCWSGHHLVHTWLLLLLLLLVDSGELLLVLGPGSCASSWRNRRWPYRRSSLSPWCDLRQQLTQLKWMSVVIITGTQVAVFKLYHKEQLRNQTIKYLITSTKQSIYPIPWGNLKLRRSFFYFWVSQKSEQQLVTLLKNHKWVKL